MPKGTVAQARRPRADDRWLVDLQMGLFGGQAFLVAFELGLFPMLASSPLGIAAVAQRAGLDPDPPRRSCCSAPRSASSSVGTSASP